MLELLESQYAEARDKFKDGKHTHEDLTIIMLKHQTNHIAHLEVDLNGKIDKVENKVDNLEFKVDNLEIKVDKLEIKVDKLESKVDKLEIKVDKLESKVDSNFKWLITTMVAIAAILTTVVIATGLLLN